MTLAELIKDIYDSSRERMRTPITGAYTIAFIIYNWQAILFMLYSDKAIETKLETINEKYNGWGSVIWPLVMATLYVILIPFIMAALEYFTKWAIEKRKAYKSGQKLHEKKLLAKILKQEFENEEIRSGKNNLETLNNTIVEKDKQIESLNDQVITLSQSYTDIIENYEKIEKKRDQIARNTKVYEERIDESFDRNIYNKEIKDKLIDKLSNNEIEQFIDFCNSEFFKLGKRSNTTNLQIKKYIELGLINININKGYSLTPLGEMVYHEHILKKELEHLNSKKPRFTTPSYSPKNSGTNS